MAATIPADVLQFFGMTLRLAQELSYLYGAQDLWSQGAVDEERVKSQLLMYCGVMLGVSSAVSGVRLLSTQLAKTTLKKLPQKALTKTFWYPLVKQIGKAVGVKVTKTGVAKGMSKAIPVVGGFVSGGLNFASMMPMAKRLQAVLDDACFGYTEEEMLADIQTIESIKEEEADEIESSGQEAADNHAIKMKMVDGVKNAKAGISGLLSKLGSQQSNKAERNKTVDQDEVIGLIEKLAKLKDSGAITQEEYDAKKSELMNRL